MREGGSHLSHKRNEEPAAQQPSRTMEPWREKSARTGGVRAVETESPAYRQRGRRGRKKRNAPLILLIIVLAGGMVFAGGKLASILLNYQRDRSAYNDLADQAISLLAEAEQTSVRDPGITPDPNGVDVEEDGVPISVDWNYLQSINSQVVGWLYAPDTVINYPVVQSSDNEYYLHRSFDDQPSSAGTLFVDVNSVQGITQSNYIIYGHTMKDNSMFTVLGEYVDNSYYQDHPVMYYITPTTKYRVELIAAHIVESSSDNYPGYFTDKSDYQAYLDDITSHSFFATNATVSTDFQLLTMSTCNYSSNYNDPRLLVQGLMIPVE